jgi:hypothetical protein
VTQSLSQKQFAGPSGLGNRILAITDARLQPLECVQQGLSGSTFLVPSKSGGDFLAYLPDAS